MVGKQKKIENLKSLVKYFFSFVLLQAIPTCGLVRELKCQIFHSTGISKCFQNSVSKKFHSINKKKFILSGQKSEWNSFSVKLHVVQLETFWHSQPQNTWLSSTKGFKSRVENCVSKVSDVVFVSTCELHDAPLPSILNPRC